MEACSRLAWSLLFVLVLAVSACGGSKNAGERRSSARAARPAPGWSRPSPTRRSRCRAPTRSRRRRCSVGGVAGKHLTLSWGLVDALQGNESQDEIVLVRRYVTTKKVVTHTESVKIPLSRAVSPLLVHFVIYAPDGSYLASDDTPDFGKGA